MALTKVSTGGIEDGSILNVDLHSAANIAGSKLADNSISLAKLLHGDSNNNGKFLRANNGADPTFETIDLTALSASNLTSGTIPDARFPSTLPAIDGSNLTGISAGVSVGNAGDERVITSDGTNLDAETLFVYRAAKNGVGIGTATPEPTASYYEGAFLHIHQAASGGSVGSQLHLTTDNTGSAAGDGSQISAYSSSLYINNQENGDTYFYNNGSSNLTIKANGNVGIGTQSPSDKLHVNGTATIGSNLYLSNNTYIASNKGIYFDGGTGSANHLDDYEEGTYTPTFVSTGASWSYNHQYGYYQKVGNTVHVSFYITLSNSSPLSGTTTNNLEIYVPFAATSATRYEAACCFSMIYKFNLNASSNQDIPLTGRLYSGRQGIELLAQFDDTSGYAYPAVKADQGGCGLAGSITYRVA